MDDTTAQLEPLSEAADAAGELADIIEGRAPLSQRLSGDDPVTVTFSESAPTLSFTLRATVSAGPSGTARF